MSSFVIIDGYSSDLWEGTSNYYLVVGSTFNSGSESFVGQLSLDAQNSQKLIIQHLTFACVRVTGPLYKMPRSSKPSHIANGPRSRTNNAREENPISRSTHPIQSCTPSRRCPPGDPAIPSHPFDNAIRKTPYLPKSHSHLHTALQPGLLPHRRRNLRKRAPVRSLSRRTVRAPRRGPRRPGRGRGRGGVRLRSVSVSVSVSVREAAHDVADAIGGRQVGGGAQRRAEGRGQRVRRPRQQARGPLGAEAVAARRVRRHVGLRPPQVRVAQVRVLAQAGEVRGVGGRVAAGGRGGRRAGGCGVWSVGQHRRQQ